MMPDKDGNTRPIPDPTLLTTEQLMREISKLEVTMGLHVSAVETRLQGDINLNRERFEALRRALDERYATQQFAIEIAATSAKQAKEDAKELSDTKIDALRLMLNERYQTQTKALGAAFVSQQAAVASSFDAAEKAMAAALEAAKEAVEKANTANDKRFESVNEFRGQLADMQTTLLPRNEADAKFSAMESRVLDMKSILDKGFSANEATADKTREYIGYIIGAIGLVAALGLLIVTMMHGGH